MKRRITIPVLFMMLLCSGCARSTMTEQQPAAKEQISDTGYVKASAGNYDSADTAVVVKINEEEETITLMNYVVGKNYTLQYDGTTTISDKYQQAIALAQIAQGDIVDVTFMKRQKRLNSIQLSAKAWVYEDVTKYELGRNHKSMTIGQDEYKLDEHAAVISGEKQAEFMDLTDGDTLIVRGVDKTIYSIVVDRGHGYLRLINDEYFIGGWIEVGQELIQPVTEGMLLAVPEGVYQVLLTNKGIEGNKEVTIIRDSEVELDVGDIKAEEIKYGNIVFSLKPAEAKLRIDGKAVDTGDKVKLEYGIHQMIAEAAGYKTITQYVKVGQELAKIDLELELQEKEDTSQDTTNTTDTTYQPGVSANTISSNNTVTNTAGNAASKVSIDAPKGAEVYVDGRYVGTAPVTFAKTEGSHTVILRKDGCQTKSYTLQLDATQKDISYSFADLVASISKKE